MYGRVSPVHGRSGRPTDGPVWRVAGPVLSCAGLPQHNQDKHRTKPKQVLADGQASVPPTGGTWRGVAEHVDVRPCHLAPPQTRLPMVAQCQTKVSAG